MASPTRSAWVRVNSGSLWWTGRPGMMRFTGSQRVGHDRAIELTDWGHVKCQAGWIKSWNQDCQEKYQQPQMWRWYYHNGRKWRGIKEPLHKGDREWKSGLKLNIQKTKIIASGPIISWQIHWEKIERMTDFVFLGSQSLWSMAAAMKLKDVCCLEEKLWQI